VIARQVVILLVGPAVTWSNIRLGAILAFVDTFAGVHVNSWGDNSSGEFRVN